MKVHRIACLVGALAIACTSRSVADVADAPVFSNGRGFDERTGASLYRAICQGCHMPDGRGATGAAAYPALANDARLANTAYPTIVVLNGRRAMPSFGTLLDDAQVAAVVDYVRSHFGNAHPGTTTADEVAALRTPRR